MIKVKNSLQFIGIVILGMVGVIISALIVTNVLIALVQLLFNIASPLMGIMTSLSNVKAAQPLVEKYKEYINVEKQIGQAEFKLKNTIKLEDISFSYPDDTNPTLNHINHDFEKNKKYAIVGENGSGKSTLLKLIAGVSDLNGYEGKILMDNVERKELHEESFWKHVSYIPQQVFLFKKKIIENIYLNQDKQFSSNFKAMVEKLDIDKLLSKEDLDNDVEMPELSGGERQKIAFIREVLKTSEVIWADEPDAALDPEAGAVIHEVLLKLKKTCIVVTHRINSNLADYDEILVMENGKIMEYGTYYELIERQGWLYQMSLNTI